MTCGAFSWKGRIQHATLGNGLALVRFEAAEHGVSVKLETVTPAGGAGTSFFGPNIRYLTRVSSYICVDTKLDPDPDLAPFGINIQALTRRKSCRFKSRIFRTP